MSPTVSNALATTPSTSPRKWFIFTKAAISGINLPMSDTILIVEDEPDVVDLLVFNLSKDQGLLVNLDRAADIARDAARYPAERLERIIEIIADTQEQIKRNANIKIALSCMRLNIT